MVVAFKQVKGTVEFCNNVDILVWGWEARKPVVMKTFTLLGVVYKYVYSSYYVFRVRLIEIPCYLTVPEQAS